LVVEAQTSKIHILWSRKHIKTQGSLLGLKEAKRLPVPSNVQIKLLHTEKREKQIADLKPYVSSSSQTIKPTGPSAIL
jgi:hypothetical protein